MSILFSRARSSFGYVMILIAGLLFQHTLGLSLFNPELVERRSSDNVSANGQLLELDNVFLLHPQAVAAEPSPNHQSTWKFSPRNLFARDTGCCSGTCFTGTNLVCCPTSATPLACNNGIGCCTGGGSSECCGHADDICCLGTCCLAGYVCAGTNNDQCGYRTVTATNYYTTFGTTTIVVTSTSTNTFTATSTYTSTSTVLETVSNVKTATAVDTTVIISKRGIFTTPISSTRLTSTTATSTETTSTEETVPPKATESPTHSLLAPETIDSQALLARKGRIGKRTVDPITVTTTQVVNGGTYTQTSTYVAGASVTTTLVVTAYATVTSTVVVGAQTTVHVKTTSTTTTSAKATAAAKSTSGNAQAAGGQSNSGQTTNPFTVTGPVAPALSTLRALVPASAQTDPTAACFIQSSYSACYATPTWWSSLPGDSQTYFSSVNSANNAACTSCPASGGSAGLSTGAKAGIGVGAVAGVAGIAALVAFLIKAGVFSSVAGGGAAANSAAMTANVSSSAAQAGNGQAAMNSMSAGQAGQAGQAQMAQGAMGTQGAGWSGVTGQSGAHAGWSGAMGQPGAQAGWTGAMGAPGAHGMPAGEIAGLTAAGVAGGVAGGALLGRRRESEQSVSRRPVAGSTISHDSGLYTASPTMSSSQPEGYTDYDHPQVYQNQQPYQQPHQQPYQQPYQQQYQQPPQYQAYQQPQQQQYPGGRQNMTRSIPEMGPVPVSPPLSSNGGQGHHEMAGNQIYESDAAERRGYP
ncbi:hypothetical protein BT63DRAFT_105389 [Microthyrium microscopicum]|uniref:Uncharacterized protein n=1 Tax=Microthyrium microscopicum TaxID=703497 RepID=A0A6A6TXX1_9PEZI|nr:hypothetical protein BT63DRAFT_105389 [Microthyrium microscopicum]